LFQFHEEGIVYFAANTSKSAKSLGYSLL